ncbi:MAG: LysM peptidoglycan-binding domain-containing protein [Deltaproteobacteria bacterium]|nr:LysM peptidoglycan-binding domain-containing protein [Deltaproteobacteria bacterium]
MYLSHYIRMVLVLSLMTITTGCAIKSQNVDTPDTQPTDYDPPISQTAWNHEQTNLQSPPPHEVIDTQQMNASVAAGNQLSVQPEKTDELSTAPTPESLPMATIPVEKKNQPVLDEALEYCQAAQGFWQLGELENALEALDQAYALILQVDTTDKPKLMQQKEDLRFTISRRILEIYASRNIVVNGNHKAIPMVMNKHIEKEIRLFQKLERKFFLNAYKRSGKYRNYMISELKKNGLPTELSWLPLIESGFKVRALSKARALGLWQFIPSTGYKFGLKRNTYIDERLDFEKSTAAAIAYLKELHRIFGDWTTVLAAYNCGEGRVLRVIRSQNLNYLDNFWDLYQRLPRETARYVPRFLATLHIIKDPDKYGMALPEPDSPLSFETESVNRQVHLNNVAKHINVPAGTLKDLNPELRYAVLPKDAYTLRVPPGTGKTLIAKLDSIPISSPPRPAYTTHRVRYGESLSTIAKKYRSTVGKIMRVNHLRKSNFIVAGQKLKIPLRGARITSAPRTRTAHLQAPATHVVKRGDSLWILAKRYGTTTKKIQALNNIGNSNLHVGQVLKISESSETPSTEGLRTYTVKKGDSPYKIAKAHNSSLKRILRINRLSPGTNIYPGQKLYID